MRGPNTELPRDRLLQLVQRILSTRSIVREVSVEEELTRQGLDSMDMVGLMLAVEAEFDVVIAGSDITPANFRSIATIEQLVMRLRSGVTAP